MRKWHSTMHLMWFSHGLITTRATYLSVCVHTWIHTHMLIHIHNYVCLHVCLLEMQAFWGYTLKYKTRVFALSSLIPLSSDYTISDLNGMQDFCWLVQAEQTPGLTHPAPPDHPNPSPDRPLTVPWLTDLHRKAISVVIQQSFYWGDTIIVIKNTCI